MYAQYHIKWFEPQFINDLSVDAVLNADSGELDYLQIYTSGLDRPPPELAVQPRIKPGSEWMVEPNDAEKAQLLRDLLPQIDALVEKLGLPVPRPVTTNQVRDLTPRWSENMVTDLTLTNGYSFRSYGKSVRAFWTPDRFFGVLGVRVKDMVGEWRLSKSQAIKLARETAKRLGYSETELSVRGKPEVNLPSLIGRQNIPRYSITWRREEPRGTLSFVSVEVDANRGRVTKLYFLSNKLPPEMPERKKDHQNK